MSTLARPEIIGGALAEYESFATLLESLAPEEFDAPSRCEGFAVRDVAGHVVGLAIDVARGVPGSRTAEQEAESLRGYDATEVAKLLREALLPIRSLLEALDDDAWEAPSPVAGLTMGRGVLTLWYDTYVHADDVRAAVGRPAERGDGLRASVEYLAGELASRGWGPAQLALDGLPEHAIGSSGPTVTGDPLQFVLAATGRTDPAPLGLDRSVNIYAG